MLFLVFILFYFARLYFGAKASVRLCSLLLLLRFFLLHVQKNKSQIEIEIEIESELGRAELKKILASLSPSDAQVQDICHE